MFEYKFAYSPFNTNDLISAIIGNFLIISFIPLLTSNTKFVNLYLLLTVTILGVFNFGAIIHAIHYRAVISQGAFAVIFETTSQEASEFFKIISLKFIFLAFVSVIIPYLFILFIKPKCSKKKISIISYTILSVLFITTSVVLKQKNIIHRYDGLFENASIYMDAKKIAYYYRERKKLDQLRSYRNDHHYNVEQSIEYSGNRTVVLVIGESLNKHHMSLYGYGRNTNPKLSTIDSLLIFKNVITSATQTRESIIRILSQATVDNEQQYITKGSVFTLAEDMGYITYWISNQMMYGISDTETSVLAKDCNKQWFLNTDWNTNSLDEKVIPVFNKILKEPERKKFIIIHLLGNHFS